MNNTANRRNGYFYAEDKGGIPYSAFGKLIHAEHPQTLALGITGELCAVRYEDGVKCETLILR